MRRTRPTVTAVPHHDGGAACSKCSSMRRSRRRHSGTIVAPCARVAQEAPMKPRAMYSRISIEADLDSLAKSRQATGVVLRALRDRLTPEEGGHAVAQLPRELKTLWRADAAPDLPVRM